jgi:hypothetical protein
VFDNDGKLRLISPGGGADTLIPFKQIHVYESYPVLDVRLVTHEGKPRRIKSSLPYVLELETSDDFISKAELKP